MNSQINYQIPNKTNSFVATPILTNDLLNNNLLEKKNTSDIFFEHKWSIVKAMFYSVLFYILTSQNVIEITSNFIPHFIGKRTAHSIIFGLLYLLLNWNN
jgi:hypothetical protein